MYIWSCLVFILNFLDSCSLGFINLYSIYQQFGRQFIYFSHYIFVVYQETWYQHWLTWWVQWTTTKPKNVSSVNRSCLSFYRGIRMTWGQIFIQAQVIKRILPQPTVFYFIWCRYSVLVDITYVQITTRWVFFISVWL